MKIHYEIEFDLPDNFPVITLTSLLKAIRFTLRDRLPRSQVRFRCMTPSCRIAVPSAISPIPGGVVLYTLNEPTGMPYPKENLMAD